MAVNLPMAADAEPPFPHVAIVGYGLIGASLGMAVRARWPRTMVIAIDRKEVVETAMRTHAADVGGDDLGLAGGAELIVLAAPVRANIEILSALPHYVSGEALVTDVSSTKRQIVDAARSLPARLTFVGGHPLAGAAVSGIETARADLFTGRPWLLTTRTREANEAAGTRRNEGNEETGTQRHEGNEATGTRRSEENEAAGTRRHEGYEEAKKVEALITAIGARPVFMDVDEHDRLIAFISHLPQFTASALMQVIGEHAGAEGLALSGRGLRDTTRLATSPADIWRDIAITNADNIGVALDALIHLLQAVKAGLADGEAVENVFDSARQWKRVLDSPED